MRPLLFLPLLFVFACQSTTTPAPEAEAPKPVDPYQHIEDEQARTILQAAIEFAGGLDAWHGIQRLRYDKAFALLTETGEVERSFEQVHDYTTQPRVIDIQSKENGKLTHTHLENGHYTQTIDGVDAEKTQEAIAKGVNTSTYVIGLPYKLLDPGAQVVYDGERTLDTSEVVDALKITYNANKHANHSSSDTWYLYFDKENRDVVANFIISPDHYSLVENTSSQRINGILFYKDRKSFRVDSLGNKLYLRAEYAYNNFVVE